MAIESYWVKGNKIIDVGGSNHIQKIIQSPELFGLTKEEVEATYKKHKERLYSEGNAREELIKKAASNGWIRVRKYNNYWSIQFDSYKKRKKTIQNLIYWLYVVKKEIGKYTTLILVGYEDNYREETDASTILKESKNIQKEIIFEVSQ